jgi:hypothetical protein
LFVVRFVRHFIVDRTVLCSNFLAGCLRGHHQRVDGHRLSIGVGLSSLLRDSPDGVAAVWFVGHIRLRFRSSSADARTQPTKSHTFFSTVSAPFFFLLLSPFLFLRSLLRRLSIVALQTSAYRVKKASRSSGCTIVLMLTWSLFFTRSFDCVSPSDARMIMGSGSVGWRSDSGLPGTFSDGDFAAVWSYVTTLVR